MIISTTPSITASLAGLALLQSMPHHPHQIATAPEPDNPIKAQDDPLTTMTTNQN